MTLSPDGIVIRLPRIIIVTSTPFGNDISLRGFPTISEVSMATASITSACSPFKETADSTFPRRMCRRMVLIAESRGLTTCSIPMVDMRGRYRKLLIRVMVLRAPSCLASREANTFVCSSVIRVTTTSISRIPSCSKMTWSVPSPWRTTV